MAFCRFALGGRLAVGRGSSIIRPGTWGGRGDAIGQARSLPARLRWLGGQYTCRLSDEGAAPESLRNLPWLRKLLDYEYSRLRYNFSTLAPAATAARLLSMHTTCNYDYRGHGIFTPSSGRSSMKPLMAFARWHTSVKMLPTCCQCAVNVLSYAHSLRDAAAPPNRPVDNIVLAICRVS